MHTESHGLLLRVYLPRPHATSTAFFLRAAIWWLVLRKPLQVVAGRECVSGDPPRFVFHFGIRLKALELSASCSSAPGSLRSNFFAKWEVGQNHKKKGAPLAHPLYEPWAASSQTCHSAKGTSNRTFSAFRAPAHL
jgi:hypothetical protein